MIGLFLGIRGANLRAADHSPAGLPEDFELLFLVVWSTAIEGMGAVEVELVASWSFRASECGGIDPFEEVASTDFVAIST